MRKVLINHALVFVSFDCFIGSHSIRKAGTTYISTSTVDPPPQALFILNVDGSKKV